MSLRSVLAVFLSLCHCQDLPSAELATFHKLFLAKRVEQLGAVKNIQKLDENKRKVLLDQISEKLFQVLSASQADLDSSGYSASVTDMHSTVFKNRVSLVLENVCLACDLLLRLPDEMHARLKAANDWAAVFKWGIGFSSRSGFLEETSVKLLSLCSQELGLVDRDPAYVNPYRAVKAPVKKFEDPPPPAAKKERLKIKKGPRLSNSEL